MPDKNSRTLRHARGYALITVFCALFGAVYERFSHGVYSYYMIYAFAVPLILGCALLLCIGMSRLRQPGRAALNLWNSGTAALTAGCIFKGVLEIYGTTNSLIVVYPIFGGAFLAAGVLCYAVFSRKTP